MKRVFAYARAVLACLSLVGCVGPHFKPNLDHSQAQLAYRQDEIKKPGLRLIFFGTSTIFLSDGANSVMTDGFFSRPSLPQLVFTKFESNQDEINFALEKAGVKKLDAILVAHSHHDHAMDSGLVAQKTGAVLYGSESTLNIARGQNTPEKQLQVLKPCQHLTIGQFQITAFDTPHSPEPVYPGVIDQPVHTPAPISGYRMAENFSFFVEHPLGNILIVPSANYREHAFDGVRADVVILAIGTLGKQDSQFTEKYWNEVVRKTGATVALPVHWDDFTQSLRKPLVPFPYFIDNAKEALERLYVLANRDRVAIRFMPILHEITLPTKEP